MADREQEARLGPELEAEVALAAAERELRRLQESAAGEPRLAEEAARLGRERGELEEQGRRVAARLAAARTRHEELSGDAGRLTARLDAARGGDATLTARLSRLNDEAELLREALEATQAAVSARDELARAKRAAEEAAAEAGFGDVRDAEAAYRSPAERERRAELLRRLDDQHAAVSGVLADPELVAAAAEPAPDLAAAGAERDALEEEHTRLASVRDRAAARARRLAELRDELAGHLERWRPAADRHRLAERMASLASGTSSDNQWSMSLSSFVLGERLRQVVAAANERLDHMSGGRYLLRHDLGKTAGARGRAGGGLGLKVADGWTGVDRDPATLSGGESFITSLALALGLADVVTAEAGGAELGTLFVDEGFGTLDEDTLDGVLDILDGLRDGGPCRGHRQPRPRTPLPHHRPAQGHQDPHRLHPERRRRHLTSHRPPISSANGGTPPRKARSIRNGAAPGDVALVLERCLVSGGDVALVRPDVLSPPASGALVSLAGHRRRLWRCPRGSRWSRPVCSPPHAGRSCGWVVLRGWAGGEEDEAGGIGCGRDRGFQPLRSGSCASSSPEHTGRWAGPPSRPWPRRGTR
ncbi:hypothetical protein GCM10020001_014140 [Nonomuraea salmonea]